MECTFSLSEHETFSRKDHITGHKTKLIMFKRIEIIQYMLSKNTEMKIESSNRRRFGKFTNIWKLNDTLLK